MTTDSIAEVGIDEQQRIYVRPSTATFPYIYREAVDVHWEAKRHYLHSTQPREWTYLQWFQHIIGAAALQSYDLRLTSATTWSDVPAQLRTEIQQWFSSRGET